VHEETRRAVLTADGEARPGPTELVTSVPPVNGWRASFGLWAKSSFSGLLDPSRTGDGSEPELLIFCTSPARSRTTPCCASVANALRVRKKMYCEIMGASDSLLAGVLSAVVILEASMRAQVR
jgi:hypothetical protein